MPVIKAPKDRLRQIYGRGLIVSGPKRSAASKQSSEEQAVKKADKK